MAESFPNDRFADQTGRMADQTSQQLTQLTRSPGWYVGFGVITLLVGLLVAIWPMTSVLTLAVVLGIWLLVAGVFRLVEAVAFDRSGTTSRVLLALLGILAILVGILVLNRPLQTVAAVALLLGAFFVIGGIIELFHGIGGEAPNRTWATVGGMVSLIAGIVVLAYPGASVLVLSWLFGIALVLLGAVFVVTGLTTGRRGRAATP